jgi:MoxR-like ATPase
VLADFQITIPELGTLRAEHRPHTFITSNRTREIHDALKRCCIYHWIDYADAERELEIVLAKVPDAAPALASQVVAFVQRLRAEDLYKTSGRVSRNNSGSLDRRGEGWRRTARHGRIDRCRSTNTSASRAKVRTGSSWTRVGSSASRRPARNTGGSRLASPAA